MRFPCGLIYTPDCKAKTEIAIDWILHGISNARVVFKSDTWRTEKHAERHITDSEAFSPCSFSVCIHIHADIVPLSNLFKESKSFLRHPISLGLSRHGATEASSTKPKKVPKPSEFTAHKKHDPVGSGIPFEVRYCPLVEPPSTLRNQNTLCHTETTTAAELVLHYIRNPYDVLATSPL